MAAKPQKELSMPEKLAILVFQDLDKPNPYSYTVHADHSIPPLILAACQKTRPKVQFISDGNLHYFFDTSIVDSKLALLKKMEYAKDQAQKALNNASSALVKLNSL